MKKLTKSTLAIAAGLLVLQGVSAQQVSDVANVFIAGNRDSSNNLDEGVFIASNTGSGPVPVDQAYLDLRTSGRATLGSKGGGSVVSALVEVGSGKVLIDGGGAEITVDETVDINTNTAIRGALGVTGAATVGGNAAVGGNASIAGTLSVQGLSTTTGINNTGTLNQTGATNVIGAASINASGAANTTIGNANNTTTIQSGSNIITGAANSMLSTGANTITAATGNAISTATGNNVITATAGSNNMTAGTANNIQGPVNNIGTSSASVNTIGNTQAATTVTSRAGNATQALANGSASTTVTGAASGLSGATVAPSGQVLLSNAGGTSVDANGKIVTGVAEGASAAVTLTNGLGNTHGLVVTESQTTLSGGTQSSSMTLTDRAATFSNAQTGAPITVTGVANGRADFDAVNVRQFAGAIAAVSAQANIPALAAGQDRNFGVGLGHFMGKSALAMGMSVRGSGNSVYKATLSSGLNAGTSQAVVGVGAAWGF